MKICPKCNTQCSDSDKFCTVCGAALSAAERPSAPAYRPEKTHSANSARFKQLAGSGLALTIAIAFTVIVLLAIVSAVAVPRTLAGYVDDAAELLEEYDPGLLDLSGVDLSVLEEAGIDISEFDLEHIDLGDIIEGVKDTVKEALSKSGNAASAISSNITGILIAICMWIAFCSAKSSENPVCSGTGFTILLILKILALIGTILLTLLFAFGGAYVISTCSDDIMPVVIGVVAVLAIILILAILYRVGLIRTLKRFIAESKGASDRGHISGYAGFILVLKGIWRCLAALIMLLLVTAFGTAAVPSLIYAVAGAVAYFGCSKFIFKAKRELTNT